VAVVDALTGAVQSWNPNVKSGVQTLAVAGKTIYIGSQQYFVTLAPIAGELVGFNAVTGAAVTEPLLRGDTLALQVVDNTIYAARSFQTPPFPSTDSTYSSVAAIGAPSYGPAYLPFIAR
jgi:hypothetical protein